MLGSYSLEQLAESQIVDEVQYVIDICDTLLRLDAGAEKARL